MKTTLIVMAVTCALLPGAAAAQTAHVVHIEEPHAGVVEGPIVSFHARVVGPAVRHATLVVNGSAYDVPVEQGNVTQQIIALPGQNRVALMVEHGGRVTTESLTFRYDGPAAEMIVLLTWPSEGEIIDLWVREPGGETCKWDHRSTEAGGQLLDFSSDAIGFGSQAYTLTRVSAGAFRLKIHYWGAHADDDRRARHEYDAMIAELDGLEARLARPLPQREQQALDERARRIRASLDRWAQPVAPQTPVRAEIVLFPGTRFERRWRFLRVVQRTGELATIGEIEIDDPTIRAARQEAR